MITYVSGCAILECKFRVGNVLSYTSQSSSDCSKINRLLSRTGWMSVTKCDGCTDTQNQSASSQPARVYPRTSLLLAWYTGSTQRHIEYTFHAHYRRMYNFYIYLSLGIYSFSRTQTLSEPWVAFLLLIAHSTHTVHHVPLKQRTTRLININYKMPTYVLSSNQ